MLLWLIRSCFITILIGSAGFAFMLLQEQSEFVAMVTVLVISVFGCAVMLTDLKERNKQISTISAVYFGLLLGLLLGWLFTLTAEPIIEAAYSGVVASADSPSPEGMQDIKELQNRREMKDEKRKIDQLKLVWRFVLTVICCYVSISTLLQTKDDFRFIIPYVEFSKQVKGGRPLVLDTSVIIDGRIADLCDTRIVDTKLIVPRFVLQELQAIADSADKLKRNRGRRGLDILKRLQSNTKIELQMHEGMMAEGRPGEKIRVDERLVLFTKSLGGRVVTNDFNLNKVAQLQGVDVINLNEVANSLKTVALPGEYLQVKVVKAGDQVGQGVGYLEDGTMVVIEQGRNLIGQETSLVVTSVLQTPAGRMIFGRPEARQSGNFTPAASPSGTSHTPVTAGGPVSGPHTPVNHGKEPPKI